MTENLLQKLEEKMILLLTEVEDLRKELKHLHQEKASLQTEKETNAKKLQDLILLLDAVNISETSGTNPVISMVKPILIQEDQVSG